ncbi:MAG: hypothetical protein GX225_01010 [Clostridiales bacterium]|nr:hypothetical protein [Clostridiales bacterium]
MSKLLKIEFMKIKSSLAFKVTLLVCLGLCLLSVAMYAFISNSQDTADMAAMMGMKISGYSMFMVSMTNSSDCIMLATIVICILIGSDFTARTLQTEISAGFSRTKIVLSRFISTTIILLIFIIVYSGTLLFGTSIFCGFGAEISAGLIGEMLLALFMNWFISVSMMSLYMLICFLFKSVGPSIGVTMPAMLIGTSILSVLAAIYEVAGKIYSFTPLGQMGVVGDTTLEALDYVKFFGVGIGFAAVMLVITVLTFRKSELK